ncbi:hypothetical protein QC762_0105430 [Podospora pseudocomata]|uniref:Uncharacterized protein n=1 Tax=Podospora pseudocomata TaxID=2093779 RepID=A0ABR0G2L6_9PEZI|nr:hypothetical protein QC762_0105430 [Podospora pseudocomata]
MSKRTAARLESTGSESASGDTQPSQPPSAKRPKTSKDDDGTTAGPSPSWDLCLLNLPVGILTIICHFIQEQDTAPPAPPVTTRTPVQNAIAIYPRISIDEVSAPKASVVQRTSLAFELCYDLQVSSSSFHANLIPPDQSQPRSCIQ